MGVFRRWMAVASTAEKDQLAELAGTSRQYLYHIAADDDAAYKRVPRTDLAQRLADACETMRRRSKYRLPRVQAHDLNPKLSADNSKNHGVDVSQVSAPHEVAAS